MNEIAELCTAAGGNVEDVRVALGADRRIGYEFLYPGLGFGGSCFPKDLRALVNTGEQLGAPLSVARAATEANKRPVARMLAQMEDALGDLSQATVAVWGLAFKPKTDDVRESPALRLVESLVAKGARVVGSDPEAVTDHAIVLRRQP